MLHLAPSQKSLLCKLEVLLQRCYGASRRRSYGTESPKTSTAGAVQDVAVLGGGVTGLATTYYLSQQFPNARITLFEASSNLGGWLRSKQINIGNGKILFEQGPRTLRPTNPNGWVTLDLIRDLGLEDQVLMTSKNSTAAQNRFIYYPNHLVRLPGPGESIWSSLYTVFSEPLFNNTLSACIKEVFKPPQPNLHDESIASFVSRRLSSQMADNVLSAVMHGIYAGDIHQLSARSILPSLWYSEKENGSLTAGFARKWSLRWPQDQALRAKWEKEPQVSDIIQAIRKSSIFTFRRGIGQLADSITTKLLHNSHVQIQRETIVCDLELHRQHEHPAIKLKVLSKGKLSDPAKEESYSHVISTISSRALERIVKPAGSLSMLAQTPSVTVMVVNLFYSDSSVLPVRGFGYLLPNSLSFEQNPERALGVVFDSDATIGQDSIAGTKVTVMLGGHWWDGWEAYPDEEEGAMLAKTILARHLGIVQEPQSVNVGLQKDCIPQYTVGHHSRMTQAGAALQMFEGRLRVAGSSYTGVGLNDCVRAARDVVMGLVGEQNRKTGLEFFDKDNKPMTLLEQKQKGLM